MDKPPSIVTGQCYFAHLQVPHPNYNQTDHFYELNLAVSDEIFAAFKSIGISDFFLHEAGSKNFTPDPVIKFANWAMNKGTGDKKAPPLIVDMEKNPMPDVQIGNGSTINVQWSPYNYGEKIKIVRPLLQAVQIVDLIERSEGSTPPKLQPEEVAF